MLAMGSGLRELGWLCGAGRHSETRSPTRSGTADGDVSAELDHVMQVSRGRRKGTRERVFGRR